MPLDLFSEEVTPQRKPLDLFSDEAIQPKPGRYDWLTSGEHVISPTVQRMQTKGGKETKQLLKGVGRGFQTMGYGFLRGTQSFWKFFDDAATLVSRATGLEKGGVFEALIEMGEPPEEWAPKDLAERVVSGIAAAGPEIGKIATFGRFLPGGVTTSMATIGAVHGGAEGGLKQAAYEATKGALLGQVLKGAAQIPKPFHAPTVGGIFAGQAAAERGAPEDIAEAGAVGLGLGLLGGRERVKRKRPALSKKVIKSLDKTEQKIFAKDAKQHGPEVAVSSIIEHRFRNAEMQIASYLKKGDTKKAQAVYNKTVANINKLTTIDGVLVDMAANWGIEMFDKMPAVQRLKGMQEIKPEIPTEKPVVSKPEIRKTIKLRKPPSAEKAKTFLGWINAMGGIWDPTLPGEVRQFIPKESGIVGLVRKRTGQPIDIMTRYAVEAGWLPEGAIDSDFIGLLRKDIFALKEKGQRVQKIQEIGQIVKGDKKLKQAEEEERVWSESIEQEAIEAKKKGFDYYGPGHEEIVGELKPGDKLLRNGEEYTVKNYDKEGNLVIQNDHTFKLDVFSTIKAEAIKKPRDFELKPSEEKVPKNIQRTPEEIERDQLEAQGQTKIEMPESKTWQPYGVGSLKEKIYPQKEAIALLESLRRKHGDTLEFRMVEAAAGGYRIDQRPKIMLGKIKAKMKEGPIRGGDIQEDLFGKKAAQQTLYSYGGREVEPYGIPETPPVLGREAGIIRIGKIQEKSPPFTFSEKTIEDRYQAAKGIKKENILTRFNKALALIKNKITRDIYENLPRTGEFMPLRNELLQLQKTKGIASHDAVRTIQEITTGLDRSSFDLFTRKVILDDLLKTSEKGKDLPLGFTPESLLQESSKLNDVLKTQPKVIEALQRRSSMWDNLRQEYNGAMKNIGFNVENRLKNEAYFRHQVLEYVNAKGLFGTGKRLKTPSSRGFLKQRMGSRLDINTDYLQAESEVVAQMLHDIKIAKTIKSIDNLYNIRESVKAEYIRKLESLLPEVKYSKEQLLFGMKKNNIPQVAYENTLKKKLRELGGEDFLRERGLEDWRQLIKKEYPEYDIWQPREGNVFFMSDSIPAQLAEELISGKLKEVGITAKDLREILAVGGRRKELVLKNEIIETLDNLYTSPSQNVISQANKKILRGWKVWTLISPRRYAKYNMRNLTGDADAVFVGNPSTFFEVPIAIKDLWQHFVKKEKMTPELRMWFDRGGFESTLQAQEMGEINNLKIFLDLQKPRGDFKSAPLKVWQTYWKKARMSTDFREAILRYAAFRDYLKQMKESGGVPKNFGASIPDEIRALSNDADKAFHLSNDLLGAYDRISISGKALREHLFPFWSWKEINFKRYVQLFKNAANDKKLCEVLGRKATGGLAKTPYQAYRVGKFLVKATALWGMLEIYNNTRFPEEEKKLPKDIRDRPHIVFGTDKDGKIQYFSRIGALGDFLEWFGLDAAPRYVRKWLDGSLSLEETAKEMAKSSVNVMAQGITPFVKIPAEIISRRSFFPDIFEPGIIRDRGYHFARNLGLENEYKAIMDFPSEGYGKSIPGVFVYRLDPLQGAYSDIYEEKQRFLKKIGKFGEGFWLTPKGDALYNFKLALRYDDNNAAKKYLKSYFMLGGTIKGLGLSLNAMNPLSGLNKQEQEAFVKTLDEENRQKLAMAFKFWVDILALPAQPQTNNPIDLFGGEINE